MPRSPKWSLYIFRPSFVYISPMCATSSPRLILPDFITVSSMCIFESSYFLRSLSLFSSVLCSQMALICVWTFKRQTKFYSHLDNKWNCRFLCFSLYVSGVNGEMKVSGLNDDTHLRNSMRSSFPGSANRNFMNSVIPESLERSWCTGISFIIK